MKTGYMQKLDKGQYMRPELHDEKGEVFDFCPHCERLKVKNLNCLWCFHMGSITHPYLVDWFEV